MAIYSPWSMITAVILFCVIGLIIPCCYGDNSESNFSKEIVLNALVPADPALSSTADAVRYALDYSADDINAFFESIGSESRIAIHVTNLSSDPEEIRNAIAVFHESGSDLVLGYFSSAQLEALKEYVDTNKMLVLSSGSSSPSLAVGDDMILRFNPDDSKQTMAIASLLAHEQINTVVPLIRDDLWGKELISTLKEKAASLPEKMWWVSAKENTVSSVDEVSGSDITILDPIIYKTNITDYSDVLSDLDQKVGNLLNQGNRENIGVLVASFGEIVPIMEKASDPNYQNLSEVRWFGTDGNTPNPNLPKSQIAAQFASDRRFTGTAVSEPPEYTIKPLREKLTQELGYEPEASAYTMYDMGWLAALATSIGGKGTGPELLQAVSTISHRYSGNTGKFALNEAGDMSEAHYTYWTLTSNKGNNASWNKIGSYAWYGPQIPVDAIFYGDMK